MPSAELAPGRTMTSAGRAATAGAATAATRATSSSGTAARRMRVSGDPRFAVLGIEHPPVQVLTDRGISHDDVVPEPGGATEAQCLRYALWAAPRSTGSEDTARSHRDVWNPPCRCEPETARHPSS